MKQTTLSICASAAIAASLLTTAHANEAPAECERFGRHASNYYSMAEGGMSMQRSFSIAQNNYMKALIEKAKNGGGESSDAEYRTLKLHAEAVEDAYGVYSRDERRNRRRQWSAEASRDFFAERCHEKGIIERVDQAIAEEKRRNG